MTRNLRRRACAGAVFVITMVAAPAPVGAGTGSAASARTGATATIKVTPAKGLMQGSHVQVSGSGFAPNESVVVAECKAGHPVGSLCDESNARFQIADARGGYSLDFVVNSTLIATSAGLVNCTTRPGACIISVANDPGFDNTGSAPISFSSKDVISRYTGAEVDAVSGAARALGVGDNDVPRLGTFALAWVLALTHTGPITPVPSKGAVELVTDYQPPEYDALSTAASTHGTTLAEFQKTGALFLAYELSIS